MEQRLAALTEEQQQNFLAGYVLKSRSRSLMLCISFFLGWFGVDRFLIGNRTYGMVKLLTLLGSIAIHNTLPIWILWLIDLFLIHKSADRYNEIQASKILEEMTTGTGAQTQVQAAIPSPPIIPVPVLLGAPIVAPSQVPATPEDNAVKPRRRRRTPEEMRVARLESIANLRIENLKHSLAEQKKQTGIGITHYDWLSAGDEAVCAACRAKDGKTFAWDSPPPGTGHPGQCTTCDRGYCRCIAVPYIPEAESP